MRNILREFIGFTIRIVHIVISAKFEIRYKLIKQKIYSIWISNKFNQTGEKFNVKYPLYLYGGKFITIGNNFNSGYRFQLEAHDEHLGYYFSPQIKIGNNVSINHDCHIGAINKIIIEDDVLIASKVFITDHYHGEISKEGIKLEPSRRKLFSKGPVFIGKGVWIGEGVAILPNVTIGANCIIGANSVITKNIPKNSVVGGNPARIIRTL